MGVSLLMRGILESTANAGIVATDEPQADSSHYDAFA